MLNRREQVTHRHAALGGWGTRRFDGGSTVRRSGGQTGFTNPLIFEEALVLEPYPRGYSTAAMRRPLVPKHPRAELVGQRHGRHGFPTRSLWWRRSEETCDEDDNLLLKSHQCAQWCRLSNPACGCG